MSRAARGDGSKQRAWKAILAKGLASVTKPVVDKTLGKEELLRNFDLQTLQDTQEEYVRAFGSEHSGVANRIRVRLQQSATWRAQQAMEAVMRRKTETNHIQAAPNTNDQPSTTEPRNTGRKMSEDRRAQKTLKVLCDIGKSMIRTDYGGKTPQEVMEGKVADYAQEDGKTISLEGKRWAASCMVRRDKEVVKGNRARISTYFDAIAERAISMETALEHYDSGTITQEEFEGMIRNAVTGTNHVVVQPIL